MYPNNPTWQISQGVNAHHNKSSAPQEISSADPVTEFYIKNIIVINGLTPTKMQS